MYGDPNGGIGMLNLNDIYEIFYGKGDFVSEITYEHKLCYLDHDNSLISIDQIGIVHPCLRDFFIRALKFNYSAYNNDVIWLYNDWKYDWHPAQVNTIADYVEELNEDRINKRPSSGVSMGESQKVRDLEHPSGEDQLR